MAILQLKISLKGVSPPVWRRILVEDNITFDKLHNIIQSAMGWGNYHLYLFDFGGLEIGIPDEEFDREITNSMRVRLSKYVNAEGDKFEYVYDFGDNWVHTVIVEKILEKDPNGKYPVCLKGKNACPPDDCGGPWGYKELLEAIKNPNHKEHKEMLEWIGKAKIDPEEFDINHVNELLSAFRKRQRKTKRSHTDTDTDTDTNTNTNTNTNAYMNVYAPKYPDKTTASNISNPDIYLDSDTDTDISSKTIDMDINIYSKNEEPSEEKWKELYSAAEEFKKTECWAWMHDTDIFGVENPKNSEIGYCCIMGMMGEHFGLALYLGTEGLEGYLKVLAGEGKSDPLDLLHVQKCLTASFDNKDILKKPDLETIRNLGLKFTTNALLPQFRTFTPGYHPWYLKKEEAVFLAIALRQATNTVLRYDKDRSLLDPKKDNKDDKDRQYLVRVFESSQWKDKWLSPAPFQKKEIVPVPIDENRLEKIISKIPELRGYWEIDYFYSPASVQEKSGIRPHYPEIMLWADHQSGQIINFHIMTSLTDIVDQTLKLAEKTMTLPEEIHVIREEALIVLEPVAKKLGVRTKKVQMLREINNATQELKEWIR